MTVYKFFKIFSGAAVLLLTVFSAAAASGFGIVDTVGENKFHVFGVTYNVELQIVGNVIEADVHFAVLESLSICNLAYRGAAENIGDL